MTDPSPSPSPVRIRAPRHGDAARLTELYREAFSVRLPGRRLHPRFTFENTLVATVDDAIVGLGCVARADADLDPQLACLDPAERRILALLADDHPGDIGTPAVEILAPPGVAVVRRPGDLVYDAIAVDPQFRRRGVAAALVGSWISLAANDGWRRMFVHCVDGTGSRELFRGQGFLPLVHYARHYSDGSGMTLLVRPLRAP